MERYYKGRYIIAAYDAEEDEELVGLFDNIESMSELTGQGRASLACSIGRAVKGKVKEVFVKGRRCRIHLIEAK